MKLVRFFTILLSLFLFSNITSAQFSVLLVNDNANGTDRYLEIDTTLSNIGVEYEIYNTVETGVFPDLSIISPYDVVIWYTGNDGADLKLWDTGNPNDFRFNEPLIQYLDNGGIVWLQGLDFFYDIVGGAPDEFTSGQFIYDYMGVEEYVAQSHADGDDLPQLDVVQDNPICTFTPMTWVYPDGLWYADALEITETADEIYEMGPQGYQFEGYACGVYNVFENSKIFTLAVETARIDTEAHTDELFAQVLDYFESISGGGEILVTDIIISGQGGSTSIDVNNGTLQMLAEVLPEDATNQSIFWSVINETGMAVIDQDGLLQATGTSIGNGTVWVKAEAVDGSGVADSLLITISNQGGEFEVLLVNDNANGSDRYLEIDTTLTNLEYPYDIYNTVITDHYPDITTLSFYDVVIWYTGNDGAGLYLWDVSDTNNYKFNEPLIEYLDNGGVVWLQGLDFFYDIKGAAPDYFESGQFIYDYMGVSSYYAQSYSDDGEMGLPQIDVVPDNPICEITPMQWTYTTLWYADALEITPSAQGIYTMGPDGYVFDDYYTGVYNEYESAKILSFTVETARIDTEENTDELFFEVLEFFRLINGVQDNNMKSQSCSVKHFPNPVSEIITFELLLPEASNIELSIFNLMGKQIYNEDLGYFQKGSHQHSFSIVNKNLPAGMYSYVFKVNNQTLAGKMIITK